MNKFNREGRFGRRDSGRSSNSESGSFGRRPRGRISDRSFGRKDSGSSDEKKPDRFFSERNSSRSNRSFSGRDSGRRPLEMHKVTCDKCNQACEVPFKPTIGKPVYCSDCFRKIEKSDSRKPNEYHDKSSENLESDKYKQEFEKINEKLNKILKSLEID